MNQLNNLKKFFTSLPGVGPRQAMRFVLALLNQDEKDLVEFARAIANLKTEVKLCKQCFYLTDDTLCHICKNPKRNNGQIMVVEKITDLEAVERTHQYKGLYHVLGGALNPPDGITPEKLALKELEKRVNALQKDGSKPEVILALSATPFGDTTALYINQQLKPLENKIALSKLGRGLSFGSSLEYVDELTLKEAFEKRS